MTGSWARASIRYCSDGQGSGGGKLQWNVRYTRMIDKRRIYFITPSCAHRGKERAPRWGEQDAHGGRRRPRVLSQRIPFLEGGGPVLLRNGEIDGRVVPPRAAGGRVRGAAVLLRDEGVARHASGKGQAVKEPPRQGGSGLLAARGAAVPRARVTPAPEAGPPPAAGIGGAADGASSRSGSGKSRGQRQELNRGQNLLVRLHRDHRDCQEGRESIRGGEASIRRGPRQ